MRNLIALMLALAIAPVAFGQTGEDRDGEEKAGEKAEAAWTTLKTGFKLVKKFNYTLPPQAAVNGRVAAGKTITTRLPLPSSKLATVVDGRKLGIDLNGDMKPDVWCKGAKLTTQVVLEYPDGKKAQYGVLILRSGKTWTMSRSCYRYASFKGTRITLIDNDSDGYYDKFGTDSMIVGKGSIGQHLSSQIAIKGKVYDVKVNRSGTQIQVREWTGQMGKADIGKKFKAKGKLAMAMLVDGDKCFDAAKGATIPVGTYTLQWGVVAAGSRMCQFKGSKRVEVKAEGVATLAFGAPFKMDFSVTKSGTKVTIPYRGLVVSDDAGMTYFNFNRRLMPYFQIRDAQTKKIVDKGKMSAG